MASRKQKVEHIKYKSDQIVTVPLALIDAKYDNVRWGDFTAESGDETDPEQSNSFAELRESIKLEGQKEPVVLRPIPKAKAKSGAQFELIAGFRRFAAIRELGKAAGTENPTIRAVVEELDDFQAVIRNTLENTSRQNLSGTDLAYAAWKISKAHEARGDKISDNRVAAIMGKNQRYISGLLNIMRMADQRVPKHWREEAQVEISYRELEKIAKLDKPQQWPAYQALVKGRGDDSGDSQPGETAWVDRAKKQIAKVGTLLGTLEREGCIQVDMAWDEKLEAMGIKLKDTCTQRQRNSIAKVGREAYSAALSAEPETEASEESESE